MKTQKFDIYEMVTNLIIERLEAGVVPWKMPWNSAGAAPCNLISKKLYRGFNFWYLLSFNLERPWFLTFNQAKELGGSIRKGSKSYQVVFWKLLDRENSDGTKDEVPMLRYYRVFHIDDVEGIPEDKIPTVESHDHDFDPIAECEQLVEFWEDSPTIELNKAAACYRPLYDKVEMPNPRNFFQDEEYYSVLFHELCHSTGHRSRTNRHEKFPDHCFGSQDYSMEELVAEMGAAYMCGICGIQDRTIKLNASYIDSWLRKFKSDKKFVIQAASYAQKAVDYILEHQRKPVETISLTEKEAIPVSLPTEEVGFSF